MASKYPFPYDSIESGQRDKWSKLGGHELISILKAGWYQIQNRKDRNAEISEAMTLARKDPQFKALLDKARKQVKNS